MTPEEINRAIPEACGWKFEPSAEAMGWCESPNGRPFLIRHLNFYGSLNAMAEARKTLKPAERFVYGRELRAIIIRHESELEEFDWSIANATAAQHAEAWLRAKGLWREPTPPPASS